MKFLEPTGIGNIILKNRIAMALMTRSRENDDGIVGPLTILQSCSPYAGARVVYARLM